MHIVLHGSVLNSENCWPGFVFATSEFTLVSLISHAYEAEILQLHNRYLIQ